MVKESDIQRYVHIWCNEVWAGDPTNITERSHRFLEEAIELYQAIGLPKDDCLKLVEYVYGREKGEVHQELGGVYLTLIALCNHLAVNLDAAGMEELGRCWYIIDMIREKRAKRPKDSPLPQ